MHKVHKFGTGDVIPEGAVYLHTVVQDILEPVCYSSAGVAGPGVSGGGSPGGSGGGPGGMGSYQNKRYVWHYFLVEVEDEQPRAFSAGIVQLDGEDFGSAKKGDLFILLDDTKANRHLQSELLRS